MVAAEPGMWRAPCHTVPSSISSCRSVTTTKSNFCRFDADGLRRPASRMRSTSAAGDPELGVAANVAAGGQCVPRFPGQYVMSPISDLHRRPMNEDSPGTPCPPGTAPPRGTGNNDCAANAQADEQGCGPPGFPNRGRGDSRTLDIAQ